MRFCGPLPRQRLRGSDRAPLLPNGRSRAIPVTAEREKRRARRVPSEQPLPGAATLLGAGAGSARQFRHGTKASLPRGGTAAGRCWGRSPVMGRRVAARPRGAGEAPREASARRWSLTNRRSRRRERNGEARREWAPF